MAQLVHPDVIVYVCRNCIGEGERLPRQWDEQGAHVLVREVPCSGKMDAQYLLRALEGGLCGICVVACPKGECSLAEGNYRAEVRIRTIGRLLAEIGIEPRRAQLLHCSPDDPPGRLRRIVRDAVAEFCALGESPIRTQSPLTAEET